ncbi:MAG: hypothetical protein KGZ71_02845 [Desulfobulbaceae bacterium]|nr:hypothetical protein [Candidatus Kapabacteria bacterium]MBS3999401.1 hypothetical protein [Desulfobulbaceae bacterium]
MFKFMHFILFVILISNANFNILKADENQVLDTAGVEDDFEMFRLRFKSSFEHPTFALNYGIVTPFYHEDAVTDDFAILNSINVQFGISYIDEMSKLNSSVFKHENNMLAVSYYSQDLGSKTEIADGIRTSAWSFGLQRNSGYGIGKSSQKLFFNSISGITWTSLDFEDKTSDTIQQTNLDVFGSQLRFGNMFEASMTFYPIENVGLNVGYERAMVYPRHMFWYWAASGIIQGAAQGLTGWFSKAVIEKSPVAGAIMYFVLENAVNYGFFELRKKNMNWPLETVPPFMYDSFKVGLTFKF